MKGKPITTPEQLLELAANKKSVLITGFAYDDQRLPASSLLYRQFRYTIDLLHSNRLFEYIKEPKRSVTWFTKKKLKD